MNTQVPLEITCNLRQGQSEVLHRSNNFGKIFLIIIVLVSLGLAIGVGSDNIREYDKANQQQDQQNAEKLRDQETAPAVVTR